MGEEGGGVSLGGQRLCKDCSAYELMKCCGIWSGFGGLCLVFSGLWAPLLEFAGSCSGPGRKAWVGSLSGECGHGTTGSSCWPVAVHRSRMYLVYGRPLSRTCRLHGLFESDLRTERFRKPGEVFLPNNNGYNLLLSTTKDRGFCRF